MNFDEYQFAHVGFGEVYHLMKIDESGTLCGYSAIWDRISTLPAHMTRRKMQSNYKYLKPCKRCERIQRSHKHEY